MLDFLKKKDHFYFEIIVINLTILCYLFRTAIPFLKYPFLLLFVCLIIYCVIYYRKQLLSSLADFFGTYYLLFILALMLFIAFIFSNKLYLTIFKDAVNILILLSIFFILNLVVSRKKTFDFFVSNLVYLIVLFALIISITQLLDTFDILPQSNPYFINNIDKDSSLIDYNFALLPVFFGIIGVFYSLQNVNPKLKTIYLNFLLIIFSLNIILSGSRRGFFLLIGIFIILLLIQFAAIIINTKNLKKIAGNFRFFLLSLISVAVLSYLFVFKTSADSKTNTLEFFGSNNVIIAKYKITNNIFRYYSAFYNESSYSKLYKIIWSKDFNVNEILAIKTLDFDRKDPDSGWGERVHKTIFPLVGENVEIVPAGAKGYLLDSTCNSYYSPDGNYSDCFSLLGTFIANIGERYKASVYCYISDKFDADAVRLTVPTDYILQKKVLGNAVTTFDLDKREIWEKLEIEFESNESEVPIYISFVKKGVKDFSKLQGYVIFAYPHYEKINKTDSVLSFIRIQKKSDYSDFRLIDLAKNGIVKKCYESLNQAGDIICTKFLYYIDHNHNKVITSKEDPSIIFASNTQKYFSSGLFCLPLSILQTSGSIQNDIDPIRNWASKFISEDTTYYPYKSNIVLDTISNAFIGDRLSRWEFSLKIYSKEYDWKQKIFGGGFNFLNWYGYYFDKDKTRSDYPHNPFLSVLLYSGLFGLILYLIFIVKVFYYYAKYYKKYNILFVFFIITFFFSFFSAGSPFDPPMMGFFVILPFFIHSIHRKYGDEVI